MDSKQVRGMMEAYASIYEKKCVDKKDKGMHNCAKKVCHEQYGEGETIFGQHAVPDENGFVSHYNVQFEHGIVENVSVEDMEVLTLVEHPQEGHEYEGEMIDENRLQRAVDKVTRAAQGGLEGMGVKINRTERGTPTAQDQKERIGKNVKEDLDTFDVIKGHLIDEGYADTEEAALVIMSNMSEEWRTQIIEQSREGFRPDGRYQLPDGRTTGAVSGALRGLSTGNLPRQRTVIPPTPSRVTSVTQTKKPQPKTPYSKTDSGELTDFGAGGGKAKMKETGMSASEVEQQGRANKGKRLPQIDDHSKYHK
jgi:hypothetical protein